MAPKTTHAADEGRTITVLCTLIMSCEDFKADMTKMTEVLGLSHHKNAPRAINSLISPHGFEIKGGKVVRKGSATIAAPEKAALDAAAGDAGGVDGAAEASAEPPKTTKKAAARAPAKGGKARKALPAKATKKRKLDEVNAKQEDAAPEEEQHGWIKEENANVNHVKEELGDDVMEEVGSDA